MISPLTAYAKEKNKEKLRKEIFPYFNNKYFVQPFVETGFLETTERFAVRKTSFFHVGRIYTWEYKPTTPSAIENHDKQPLVLIHGQFRSGENMIVQGLNLNFFPEFAKVEILETFYNVFKTEIANAEKAVDSGQVGAFKRAWEYLTDWNFVLEIFNKKANIGYQWGIRNYSLKGIKNPVLIELEDWNKIPYYVPQDIAGKGLAEIWSDYLEEKKMLSERTTSPKKGKQLQKKYIKSGK